MVVFFSLFEMQLKLYKTVVNCCFGSFDCLIAISIHWLDVGFKCWMFTFYWNYDLWLVTCNYPWEGDHVQIISIDWLLFEPFMIRLNAKCLNIIYYKHFFFQLNFDNWPILLREFWNKYILICWSEEIQITSYFI